jgi:hypothetical protein
VVTAARPRKEHTVSQSQSKDPGKTEVRKNVEVAEAEKSDDVTCDNHPGRKARNFTGGGAYSINLCDECTPPWFKNEDAAR